MNYNEYLYTKEMNIMNYGLKRGKMSQKKVNARPKNLKPSVKRLIAEKAIRNLTMDRRLLALELINEITAAGEIPPTEETCISYISNARSKYSIDKSWSSAELVDEPISPVAVHLLIVVQRYRKLFYSKPLTIREARWFNNLSDFQESYSYLPDMITPELKSTFLSLKIATWAQMYAYREKIDTIDGVKEADYSELDNGIAAGNLHELFKYNLRWANDRLSPVFNDENATKNAFKKTYFSYLKPALFDTIREVETFVLGHSLGDPDMTENSILLYGNSLGTLFTEASWNSHLEEINYQQKLNFLRFVREWCKNKPDLEPNFDYSNPDVRKKFDSVISNILENVKKQPGS